MSFLFLNEYIKDIRRMGAVAPSSRFLARKMANQIDFMRAKLIIEYGPGTGVFTSEIVRRMQPGTKLIIIETNPVFYAKLLEKYKKMTHIEVINDSAEHIASHHTARALPAPDYIISGLPFAALPEHTSKKILSATAKLLGAKGVFVTFQYTLLKRKLFETYFSDIRVARELRNIPPAYILRCR